MSRIGNSPIPIPEQVEVKIEKIDGRETIEIKGPKGELSQPIPEPLSVSQEENAVLLTRVNDEKESRALHGLARSLIQNMVVGVTEGYQKELEIIGVGYRAEVRGADKLVLQLGFSHPVEVSAPEGIVFEVPEATRILVSGIDKQSVGQAAAEIRELKKPEPYKGKGIRYKGEYVIRKATKT